MNKTAAATTCLLLMASPVLIMFLGSQSEASTPLWQMSTQSILNYARRQPARFASLLTGKDQSRLGLVRLFETECGRKRLSNRTNASLLKKALRPEPDSSLQAVQDTGAAIATIPEATVHVAGAALISIKHASVESLRSSLQWMEAAYLRVSVMRLPTLTQAKEEALRLVKEGSQLARDCWGWIGPGGRLHPTMFLEEYHGHILVECLLAVVIMYLFFQSSFKWSKRSPKLLTEEEIDDLCEEWQPEPLYSTLPAVKHSFTPVVISSSTGPYVNINDGWKLNMVAFNFLGTAGDPKILEACKATVTKYGVGACGPRGFYGTIDVHLELEERLAKFMEREEAIIYSYDLSTMPSVLPAFANAKDLLVVDEMANYAIQNGANLSRAVIVKFKHNDMEDLERVLKAEVAKHEALKKPLNRRFIVVEGIYAALGDLAPLSEIVRLKRKYKFRLVVDESLSFGVLGATGRGACQHFGLQNADVEIICASMGNSLASIGGFCVGDRVVVDHQRLSGLGYCFSAALPPYLATAAMGSMDALEQRGADLLATIQRNASHLRKGLGSVQVVEVIGTEADLVSPVVHVRLRNAESADREDTEQMLQKVVDESLEASGVLLTVARASILDKVQLTPSIRLAVTAGHKKEDIDSAISALSKATQKILPGKR